MNLFNLDLINKYDTSGPRYTSYPSANNFDRLSIIEYKAQANISNKNNNPLSIYCHIPFCDTVCFYCGCNKIATKDKTKSLDYLDYLFKEIDLQAEIFSDKRKVKQLHFGGGTPTFLSAAQLKSLTKKLHSKFKFSSDGEYSIEIDPRGVNEETIATLRECLFNRISLGVQDFNEDVQKAVNRIQSYEETKFVVDTARKYGFKSISIDLIYGLPLQTEDSFKKTLNLLTDIMPDRISLFNYAHLPHLFKPQRRINVDELPSAYEKLNILQYSINFLLSVGYVYIGMDHFALPDDPLYISQKNNELYRNFQGYSTYSNCDIIGLGVSAIGSIANSYSQNAKNINDYYQFLEKNEIPIAKGLIMNLDDEIRNYVITKLICNFKLNFSKVEDEYDINFKEYFKKELNLLKTFQKDKLLELKNDSIKINTQGRLLIRSICMSFDAYLAKSNTLFSKII